MSDPDNCKKLLELILNIEIEQIQVDSEKNIINHPEYRSIRLDVYAKDEENTRYNIEMQVASQKLEKRTRYYHSQMDLDTLNSGVPYAELPDSYVIFICDFDPFGLGLYQYTVKKDFREMPGLEFDDGSYTIFLSTKGTRPDHVSDSLVEFLEFLGEDSGQPDVVREDSYIKQLEKSIASIKRDRFWSDRYMLFGELIDEEKKIAREEGLKEGLKEGLEKGRIEGLEEGLEKGIHEEHNKACTTYVSTILTLLSRFGDIPDSLKIHLEKIDDLDGLSQLIIRATDCTSLEEFESIL